MFDITLKEKEKIQKEITSLIKKFFNDYHLKDGIQNNEDLIIKSQIINLLNKLVLTEEIKSDLHYKMIDYLTQDPDTELKELRNIILINFNYKIKKYLNKGMQNNLRLLNLYNNKSFIYFLEQDIVTNIYTELFLVKTRKLLLEKYANNFVVEPKFNISALPVIIALSHQCFNNEYIWNVTNQEIQNIEKIKARVRNLIDRNNAIPINLIIILSCYNKLNNYKIFDNHLTEMKNKKALKSIIQRQIIELGEEKEIEKKVKTLTEIDDITSQIVMKQYEDNPYPRWINLSKTPIHENYIEFIKNSLPKQDTFKKRIKAKQVLIAGCGTGKHALEVAKIDSSLDITAIDISKPSIAYGIRKSFEFGIRNIKWEQADILKLDKLNKQFDIVESSGVIHHLKDPNEGFRMLDKKLKKGGLMKLGLYARNFRSMFLSNIKEYISKNKFDSDIKSIRKLRLFIINNSNDERYQKLLRSPDIYSTSDFRDLLMHEQEHDFTIHEINKMISDKYKFLGFFWNEKYSIKAYATFNKLNSKKSKTNLLNWIAVEKEVPEIFSGMYQFWLQKKH